MTAEVVNYRLIRKKAYYGTGNNLEFNAPHPA